MHSIKGRGRKGGSLNTSGRVGFTHWNRSQELGFAGISARRPNAPPNLTVFDTKYRRGKDDDDNDGDDGDNDDCESSSSGGGDISRCENDDLPNLPKYFLGTEIKRSGTNHSRANNAIVVDAPTTVYDNRPPSPWGNSTTKKKVIEELKDAASDIHLHIGTYTSSDWSEVNFTSISRIYAPRYQSKLFRENLKRLLKHKLAGTGPFEEEAKTIKPWTSKSGRSKGWNLLYGLYMDPVTCVEVKKMSLDELWNSDPNFKCYPKQDFRKYNKAMVKVTDIARIEVERKQQAFEQDCRNFPHNEKNNRGEPFWYNHPAKSLLAKDVESGLAYNIKPKVLRETKPEYKQFSLKTFRKHIHQEKEKQRAAPFWRHKRNTAAQEKIAKEREEMKQQWKVDQVAAKLDSTLNL